MASSSSVIPSSGSQLSCSVLSSFQIMAPWPKLENAQPNPNKFIEGASGPQSNTAVKDKKTSKNDIGLL